MRRVLSLCPSIWGAQDRRAMDTRLQKPDVPRSLIVSIALALVAILAGGVWFYRDQESRLREDVECNLLAINRLKALALVEWRREALADAAYVAESQQLGAALTQGLAGLLPAERERLCAWLESYRPPPLAQSPPPCLVPPKGGGPSLCIKN